MYINVVNVLDPLHINLKRLFWKDKVSLSGFGREIKRLLNLGYSSVYQDWPDQWE